MNSLHFQTIEALHPEIIDILPTPVLVKDDQLRYVLVNKAFEALFNVSRADLIGELDQTVFKDRQAAQCNAGDLRVLNSGEIDEAYETVFTVNSEPRETITRKSRLTLPDGRVFLVGIMHDITEVSHTNQKLQESQELLQKQAVALAHMAHTDPLTGCGNRRAFSQHTRSAFASHDDQGGLLILDIDHFKRINDTYGHDVGDAVLVHLVETMKKTLRNTDDIIRLGGEEFAVVLPGASTEALRSKAEQIRRQVESSPMIHNGQPIRMTVSIGVVQTQCEPGAFNLDRLLSQGDDCLYEAKKNGRNRVVYALCP